MVTFKNKILLAAVVLFLLIGNYAHAAQIPITNWAWSSNIGWINLNSNNPGSGSGGTYGVTLDDATGNLTGYAWSSNIGWIKFGGLSGFPPGGNSDGNAKVTLTGLNAGKVTGWARTCAGTVNNTPNQNLPGDCSSMNSRTDGWDGWIELSGANHISPTTNGSGGVTYGPTSGVLGGYAWGGDVVGWIDFTPAPPCLGAYATVSVTGSTGGGGVWGSGHWPEQTPNQYTQDSEVAKAAVHDGLIAIGQTATIAKISTGSSNNYVGSLHNNITTWPYTSPWPGMRLCVVNPAPTGLAVVPGSCGADGKPTMVVSWERVEGATGGYKLYRTPATQTPPATNASPITIPSGNTVTFTDTGLVLNSLYGYHVSAMYGAVEGGKSLSVSNRTLASCGTPTLTASLTATPSNGLATLNSILSVTNIGGSASGPITYQFKCQNAHSFSTSQPTNTYSCSYPVGTYIASAIVTREGITPPELTITITATSQTCSIGSITQSGNDILIPVTVYPRSSTWTKLTSNWGFDEREKNDTRYIFTDYGAGAQVGTHTYNLTYGACNDSDFIIISSTPTTSFGLSISPQTIEIVAIGSPGGRTLTSSAANITITPNGGFNSSVTLSLESVTKNGVAVVGSELAKFIPTFSFAGLTPGATISIGSPYGVPNSVPKLTITSNKNNPIPIGQYVLTIKGDGGGGKVDTKTIILNVRALSPRYEEF